MSTFIMQANGVKYFVPNFFFGVSLKSIDGKPMTTDKIRRALVWHLEQKYGRVNVRAVETGAKVSQKVFFVCSSSEQG